MRQNNNITDTQNDVFEIEPDCVMYISQQEIPSCFESAVSSLPSRKKQYEQIKATAPQEEAFKKFLIQSLSDSLGTLKPFTVPGSEEEVDQLRKHLGILDKYNRLFEEITAIFRREGIFRIKQRKGGKKSLSETAQALTRKFPGLKARAGLLVPCLDCLSGILQGKQVATDVIFPESSMKLVEGIYKGNMVADYFNERMVDSVEAFVIRRMKDLKNQEKIRIMEIGAGTGGTSAFVFKRLEPYKDRLEYVYTDISKSFLTFAEKKYFPDNPYISFRTFNVEIPLIEQNMETNSFDLVLAANVLHATQDMVNTMNQVKALLKTNGVLIVNEMCDVRDFSTLTFGLLEGWWLYRDEELRLSGSPGLSPESWNHLLQHQGFDKIAFVAEDSHEMGQQIIVAESNGVFRQKKNNFDAVHLQNIPAGAEKEINENRKKDILKSNSVKINPGILNHDYEVAACNFIKKVISGVLRMSPDQLDESTPFENYGIDSILIVQLTNELEKKFGNLPKTLFFSNSDVKSLTSYFIKKQGEKLVELLGLESPTAAELMEVEVPEKNEALSWFDTQEEKISHEDGKKLLNHKREEIAIIGISGRYPGADNLDEFWEILKGGKDCISEVPADRWDYNDYYKDEKTKKGNKWGGFLNDVDKFDPLFFNISPRDAEAMDPQERLFLETAWATFEDAGYTRRLLSSISGEIGVYAGVMYGEYRFLGVEKSLNGNHMAISNTPASIANRVSYICNLTGPSMALDTQCSSSLTAIHLACEGIRNGSLEMALAGGVNISIHPNKYIALTQGKFLSSKGRCEAFGFQGDGFIPGEGVGCVLLKALSKAEKDGDHIYGIIKGSSLNHGGKTNGYTVPNPKSQGAVIAKAFKDAGVHPRQISYIEAHGTGTALGDPVEIEGLTTAFREQTEDSSFCSIGSVKSNIGHCESAAGIASVTKIVLQLQHKKLAPSLHAEKLNPNIDFDETPFVVQQTFEDWKRPVLDEEGTRKEYPRIAGVSSFGAGGSNAHVIIREYIRESTACGRKDEPPGAVIVPLSARSEDRLKVYAGRLLEYIFKKDHLDLPQISFTLQTGREEQAFRLAIVAGVKKDLINRLKQFLKGVHSGEGLFTGNKESAGKHTAVLSSGGDNEVLAGWIVDQKTEKIAEYWAGGGTVDWDGFYKKSRPVRISLPSYPFERERYWVPELKGDAGKKVNSTAHPLLERNTSTFEEQSFSTLLTGDESFLADHLVGSNPVFPAAAYLEMARAAGCYASGEKIIKLKEVFLFQPLTIKDKKKEVVIRLYPDNKDIAYEVISLDEDRREILHNQGVMETGRYPEGNRKIDITGIKKRCMSEIGETGIYDAYASLGINYGKSFRGIKKISYNRSEAVSVLDLSQLNKNSGDDVVLNPGFLDSALQTLVGMFLSSKDGEEPPSGRVLPFSMNTISIFSPLPRKGYGYAAFHPKNDQEKGDLKFDIVVTDDEGKIALEIKELTCRRIDAGSSKDFTDTGAEEVKPGEGADRKLEEFTDNFLKEKLSSGLKMAPHRINSATPLEDYGIDSILAMELTEDLEKVFGLLSKTLFFEYLTIKELCGYFLEFHRNKIIKISSKKKPETLPVSLKVETKKQRIFSRANNVRRQAVEDGPLDVAVIGVSGRYPGAENLEEFWKNLRDGKDCVTEIPGNRWNHNVFFDPDKNNPRKVYTKWGGFLEDVDKFDPLFFNIAPMEAEVMDPQERLFLETAWETLEDAGYTRESLQKLGFGYKKRIGVYVGVMNEDYRLFGVEESMKGQLMAMAGNSASIANRVSYYFDFHGPCISLNTMCSSSLTTIYLACQSLKNKDCDLALAGGVNLSLHLNKYVQISQGQFASTKGRCESFGEGGDGYVPGEGVGCLLLKPLSRAIDDCDNIYGIIKGAAVNHGGKTNGYTVPNPNAQSEVILEAIKQSGLDPRCISYLEAHGTGTSLGDPIEITGLTKAFRKYTEESGFCSLGSLKSNIGHLESAAGVAAVTKVLLQMKHKTLVPSLHSRFLNENIDFITTPFVVQRKLTEWKRPHIKIKGQEKKVPRISGISSFGAGGANAHVIIEEYVTDKNMPESGKHPQEPVLLPISARSEDCLNDYAARIFKYLKENPEENFESIVSTMQTGRTELEWRLAIVAENRTDLMEKLSFYLKDKKVSDGCSLGNIHQDKNKLYHFISDEDAKELVEKWIKKFKYKNIGELWTQGFPIDWNQFYPGEKKRKISLPTYPFAKERYWVPGRTGYDGNGTNPWSEVSRLHPLLEQNISDFENQRFLTRLTGQEFYLNDHRHEGCMILPGAAYVEMARAAGLLSAKRNVFSIRDIFWMRPVRVNGSPVDLSISLFPEGDRILYEVATGGEKGEYLLHNTGEMKTGDYGGSPVTGKINIKSIKERCGSVLEHEGCYELFSELGLNYGPSFRCIQKIFYNKKEVIAELKLGDEVRDRTDAFILHPGLLDGALQSVIGFSLGKKKDDGVAPGGLLPFAIKDLTIYRGIPEFVYAHIVLSPDVDHRKDIHKYDISIANQEGDVVVEIKEFICRAPEQPELPVPSSGGPAQEVFYGMTKWRKRPAAVSQEKDADQDNHSIVLLSDYQGLIDAVSLALPGVEVSGVFSEKESLSEKVEDIFLKIFDKIKNILKTQTEKKSFLLLLVPSEQVGGLYTCLSGLLKSATAENPKINVRMLHLPSVNCENEEAIIRIIQEESKDKSMMDVEVRHSFEGGEREVLVLSELDVQVPAAANSAAVKEDGVYWITGGLGGLGSILVNFLSGIKNIKIILSGRSPLSGEKEKIFEKLSVPGMELRYIQADVSSRKDVEKVFAEIKKSYGALNGIIHSAGVIKDSFILKKTKAEISAVFAPKVKGAVAIDEVTKDEGLDFIIFFSSIAGIFGNIGQCDYATANAFLDRYALYRNNLAKNGKRQGKTISVNWPLWKVGGMGVDKQTEKMMAEASGMLPMESETGIEAFNKLLTLEPGHYMVCAGHLEKMRNVFLKQDEVDKKTEISPEKYTENPGVEEEFIQLFKTLISENMKVPVSRIETKTPLISYGMNSIVAMRIISKLEHFFGSLPKTLFFQYQTIERLLNYFLEYHRDIFYSLDFKVPTEEVPSPIYTSEAFRIPSSRNRHRFMVQSSSFSEDFGIAGMSGPDSEDMVRFLQNLKKEDRNPKTSKELFSDFCRMTLGGKSNRLVSMLIKVASGRKIETLVTGSGKPVVLLPGMGVTARYWTFQILEWMRNYQILVIHQPGIGLTELGRDFSLDCLADDYMDALAQLGVTEDINLIGSSFGGMIAQRMAEKYPGKMSTLNLVCSFSRITRDDNSQLSLAESIGKDFEENESKQGTGYELLMESQDINNNIEKFLEYVQSHTISTAGLLPEIRVETNIISGSNDLVAPGGSFEELNSLIPGSHSCIIEGAGHFPHLTHRAEFNQVVIDFIEKQKCCESEPVL